MQQILRCPITGDRLRELSMDEISQANSFILKGELFYFDGTRVKREIKSGYVSLSGKYAYVVEDDIVMLLKKNSIVLENNGERGAEREVFHANKQDVQNYYDQLGWQRGEGERYIDAIKFTDRRPVVKEYHRRCDMRVSRYLKSEGVYFLDAASGPISNPEYLNYSKGFEFRICVDLSFLALKEARAKLGDKGIYLLADITSLPLQDNLIDAALSMHTIYHVPEDEQGKAFREIYRVLKPGASAVVVYSWGGQSYPMKFMRALRFVLVKAPRWFIEKIFKNTGKAQPLESSGCTEPALYFHAHAYKWFNRQNLNFYFNIFGYRSMSNPFLKTFIHSRIPGRQILALISYLEDRFPRLAGRLGEYPMIIIKK